MLIVNLLEKRLQRNAAYSKQVFIGSRNVPKMSESAPRLKSVRFNGGGCIGKLRFGHLLARFAKTSLS